MIILYSASIIILNRIILRFVLLLLLLLSLLLLLTVIIMITLVFIAIIIQVLSSGVLILGDPEKCVNYQQKMRPILLSLGLRNDQGQ